MIDVGDVTKSIVKHMQDSKDRKPGDPIDCVPMAKSTRDTKVIFKRVNEGDKIPVKVFGGVIREHAEESGILIESKSPNFVPKSLLLFWLAELGEDQLAKKSNGFKHKNGKNGKGKR